MPNVNLILVGVNHKTTPVEIREKLAFTKGKIEDSVDRLINYPEIIEHTILSTCNRVEIYARANNQDSGINFIKNFFRFSFFRFSILRLNLFLFNFIHVLLLFNL